MARFYRRAYVLSLPDRRRVHPSTRRRTNLRLSAPYTARTAALAVARRPHVKEEFCGSMAPRGANDRGSSFPGPCYVDLSATVRGYDVSLTSWQADAQWPKAPVPVVVVRTSKASGDYDPAESKACMVS